MARDNGVNLKSDKKSVSVPAVLFALVMFLVGVVVVLLSLLIASQQGPVAVLAQQLGFAFMVTGVVVTFQETVIRRWVTGETDNKFKGLDAQIDSVNQTIERRFRDFEESYGTKALALRFVAPKRAGYDEYHHWLVHKATEDISFAGHSVLHRVQVDMDQRRLGNLETAIVTKILAGSRLRVTFLDPRWEFVRRIAEGERQTHEKMLTDLTVTLGICRRLWSELEKHNENGISGSVDIRMCCEIQQYALHAVMNRQASKQTMLVGLYFANSMGMDSPLFAVEPAEIQDRFLTHFDAIADRPTSTRLIEYSPPISHFNYDAYHECRRYLRSAGVDPRILDQHCPE
jgi:hypothetical protein